jgi:Tfp pilus assembly protein PilN
MSLLSVKTKKKKVGSINLLRHQEKSAIDKFIDWAFTVGRAIVIITESVALSAFAYRFILDRQIIDLKDKIKQEQAIVKLSASNEQKFRDLQGRLAEAKTLDSRATEKTELLTQILQKAQGKISFSTLSFSPTDVTMDGIASSANAISSFTADLRGIPGVTGVLISNIGNNTATGVITVSLQMQLATTKTPDAPGNPEAVQNPETVTP